MRYYRIIEDGYDKKGGVMYTPSDRTFPIACDAKEVVDWQSLVVELKDGDYCHFCQCTGGANLVSKEFKDVLCKYIPDDYEVEFLPVKVKSKEYGDREYYILHFTKIFDVIDKDSTIYVDGTDAIIKLALDYDKVKDLHLFNSQPSISDVIISDEIRRQLKKEKLDEGIEFVPITCVKR